MFIHNRLITSYVLHTGGPIGSEELGLGVGKSILILILILRCVSEGARGVGVGSG